MKPYTFVRLLTFMFVAVLAACSPTSGMEPTVPSQDTPETDEAEPTETAVAPDADTPPEEEQVEEEAAPPPDPTPDRSMRLTPDALPTGVERVPDSETSPEGVVEPIPEELMTQILTNLQTQVGVSSLAPEDYEIIRAEAVIWSDGSLGCPEPGMMYTQALVEGYHVIIEANGETWDYRLSQNGQVKLCEQGPLRP